jgi:hypothetical protein
MRLSLAGVALAVLAGCVDDGPGPLVVPYGETADVGLFNLRVTDVNWDATDEAERLNMFNDNPGPDARRVWLDVSLRVLERLPNRVLIYGSMLDGDERVNEPVTPCVVTPELPQTELPELEVGAESSVTLCFEVSRQRIDEPLFETGADERPIRFALPADTA